MHIWLHSTSVLHFIPRHLLNTPLLLALRRTYLLFPYIALSPRRFKNSLPSHYQDGIYPFKKFLAILPSIAIVFLLLLSPLLSSPTYYRGSWPISIWSVSHWAGILQGGNYEKCFSTSEDFWKIKLWKLFHPLTMDAIAKRMDFPEEWKSAVSLAGIGRWLKNFDRQLMQRRRTNSFWIRRYDADDGRNDRGDDAMIRGKSFGGIPVEKGVEMCRSREMTEWISLYSFIFLGNVQKWFFFCYL